MSTTTAFEWKASNGHHTNSNGFPGDTGEGCLFSCSSEQTTSYPTLTLVPPVTAKTSNDLDDPTIRLAPGDDISPPNSVQANKMNGIAVPVSASAGWSTSPPTSEGVYPSCVAYDLNLKTSNNNNNSDSLELSVTLEYTNPHFDKGESMVVKVAIAKTLVNANVSEELQTELALVATQFQEFLPETKQWADITANVDYTQTANAVVDAVLQDPNAGQTAGKATVTAQTVELTLGPFSAKARLNLTFQADQLFTYQAMSIRADAADIGSHRLLPLWVNLPFAPINSEAGLSNLAVRLQAPPGTAVLPVDQYQEAYWDLKKQDDMKAATILAVSDLRQNNGDQSVGCQFQWESLPIRSTGLLAWLALPNHMEESIFDFVHIGQSLQELSKDADSAQAQVTVQVPSPTDAPSLQAPLPGHGPMGSLYRVKVKMPQAQPRQQPYFIMNLTMSDKSGSTGMRIGGTGSTMRQRLNELAEARFLKRLESIPALVKANVLRMDDVWMDAFLAFDSTAPAGTTRRCVFRVSDVHDSIVAVVQAVRAGNNFAANQLPAVLQHVQAIRGVTPGGATDFTVGPRALVHALGHWQKEAQAMVPAKLAPCAFLEFDTDGGHNGAANYIQCLKSFCDAYDVREGVVTGFGRWLNQSCASKVASAIGSVPALLALRVPEPGSEGLDQVFRRSFSAWVGSLRQPPKRTLKLSVGGVSFPAPVASRNANACEVLGLRRIGERRERLPQFGAPDVSNEDFTKTVLTGVPAGDELLLYIISRLGSPGELAKSLMVECVAEGCAATTPRGRVWNEGETSGGGFLAYDWLSMLTSQSGKKGFQLAPIMETSLSSRLEDEVSFRFNIASPSGKTSYLGRCKTVVKRAPIDSAHQPDAPTSPLKPFQPKPKAKSKQHLWSSNYSSQAALSQPFASTPFASTPSFQSASMPVGGFGGTTPGSGVLVSTLCGGPEVTRSSGGAYAFGGATPMASAAFGGAPGAFGLAPSSKERRRASGRGRGRGRPNNSKDQAIQRQEPSWKDALAVPVGSDVPLYTQDYHDLLKALGQVIHARQRLQKDPSVSFVCDICNYQFSPGEARFHCFDCQDFDACGRCRDRHTNPFHRIAMVNGSSVPLQPAEDPLVGNLLQPLPGTAPGVAPAQLSQVPKYDRTIEWCTLRIRRFLLAVLHWWPVFRATCGFRERLPATLADEMKEKIVWCFNNGNVNESLETVTIIVDSLMREGDAMRGPPGTSQPF